MVEDKWLVVSIIVAVPVAVYLVISIRKWIRAIDERSNALDRENAAGPINLYQSMADALSTKSSTNGAHHFGENGKGNHLNLRQGGTSRGEREEKDG